MVAPLTYYLVTPLLVGKSILSLWPRLRLWRGPSSSPASPAVSKKVGSLCPLINCQGLNAVTVKLKYPLPLIPSALEQLHGAHCFTRLDLRSAHNLVGMQEGNEWKTSFSTTSGHYEYRVMPYGLVNTLLVFQALINDMLRNMLGKYVVAYIDDILVYSPSLSVHVDHVRQKLRRLMSHHLHVKAEKCLFHQTSISFLGYHVDPE